MSNTHPHLITTPAGIARAEQRVTTEEWAKKLLAGLREQADALETDPLPVFETAWWEEASKKHWSDIYPEINQHTMFAVVGPVLKTYDAAIVYATTGERKYADLARKLLLHYTGYQFFAEHPDVGLNWSVWCLRALYAYDLTYDTFSEGERAKVDDFFRRAMVAVKEDDEWWIRENPGGLYNNHFAWHKLFIGSYGLFYDKPELVDYALGSDQGVRDLIEHGIRDDGLWFESSLNYHFTALEPLARFAVELRNSGHRLDLWNQRFANGRCLKDLFLGPIQTLFPDGTLPTIGDTYGRPMRLGSVALYHQAYDAYRLPELAWVASSNEKAPPEALFVENLPDEASAPPMKTRPWPEHGYVALRTQEGAGYWKGDGYSVFLSFDLDGIHSHHDKFDLMVFARGAHIAVDPEAVASAKHAFSSQIQGELNRSTVCHNTVMVDRKEQSHIQRPLDLVEFVDTPEVKLATVSDANGLVYPGVRMMRTVAATPDYVLDIFQVASDDEHTYSYLFHSLDDSGALAAEGEFTSVDLGSDPPRKWLKSARSRRAERDWSVTARQGDLRMRLTMLGEPGATLITCEFPKNDRFEKPSIPMLMAERKAKSTVFVAVLQSERGELADVKIARSEERHGSLRVSITCGGASRDFTVRRIEAR